MKNSTANNRKGGAPTRKEKERVEILEDLNLFNRDSLPYILMEKVFNEVPPARSFELFCHYCKTRDHGDAYEMVKDIPSALKSVVATRSKLVREDTLTGPLEQLYEISQHLFVEYIDLHYYSYRMALLHPKKSDNNYKFNISSSFSWRYISPHYSNEQKDKIYKILMESHIKSSKELTQIYEDSRDRLSLEALHKLLILGNQRIDINDVTNNLNSPFYLENRKTLLEKLKRDRYRDIEYVVEELPPAVSTKPLNYTPNATLISNIEKPIDYINEMHFFLKKHWEEHNELLNIARDSTNEKELRSLRKDVMSYRANEKSLPGKLVDILYVYDCNRFGFTNVWIANEITKHWKKVNKNAWKKKNMSQSTLYTYKILARKMILDRNYKHY